MANQRIARKQKRLKSRSGTGITIQNVRHNSESNLKELKDSPKQKKPKRSDEMVQAKRNIMQDWGKRKSSTND